MTLTATPVTEKKAPGRRREALREALWPGSAELIWHRKSNDGYTSIPRILNLAMVLISRLCTDGDPSMVYFDLWSRNWDENIISPVDYEEFAYGSGYIGKRGVRSWKERIYKLVDLGFIKIAPQGNREIGHVLVINPLLVCAQLKAAGKPFPDNWWPTFVRRVEEIGAKIPNPTPMDTGPF